MIGTTLSRYEITAKLGAGAMGEVWRDRRHVGRDVAFKVLPKDLATDPECLRPAGGLKLDRLFPLAIQIADALAAAHEKGSSIMT